MRFFVLVIASVLCAGFVPSRLVTPVSAAVSGVEQASELPDSPAPQTAPASQPVADTAKSDSSALPAPAAGQTNNQQAMKTPPPQPTRILGIMPNYRAVSAGTIPPPPGPGTAFKIATQNSFDYSSLLFVGVTSLMAEGTDAHPQLGKGAAGFWGYTWRGFLDKTDGNYWVIWALPSVLHQDERYFAKGNGPIVHRALYAATRILVARDYQGRNTFNTSEMLGRGISQSISLSYYPSKDQALEPFIEKFGYALGRDALTNVFREMWPDINQHVLHRRQAASDSGL